MAVTRRFVTIAVALGIGLSAVQMVPALAARQTDGKARPVTTRNRLNLTDEQKSKLKAIRDSVRQQVQALKNDKSLSDADKKAKAAEIRRPAKQQFGAVLTPAQQQKLQAMKNRAGKRSFGRTHKYGARSFRVRKPAAEFGKALNLTDGQMAQIKALHESTRQQMQALKNDKSLSAEAKRAKYREIMQARRDKFREVLTPEQQQQLDAKLRQMKSRTRNTDRPA